MWAVVVAAADCLVHSRLAWSGSVHFSSNFCNILVRDCSDGWCGALLESRYDHNQLIVWRTDVKCNVLCMFYFMAFSTASIEFYGMRIDVSGWLIDIDHWKIISN